MHNFRENFRDIFRSIFVLSRMEKDIIVWTLAIQHCPDTKRIRTIYFYKFSQISGRTLDQLPTQNLGVRQIITKNLYKKDYLVVCHPLPHLP
jgi:hypothetical protein